MLARMALLALVALALARPFWTPSARRRRCRRGSAEAGGRRDVVLVLDGSDSMGRKVGGTTPRALALRWARRFVARLRPGDSVAVLVAGDRVRPLVDPPSFDRARVDAALDGVAASRGSSDLPAALAEAFRVLERTGNPGRDVIVLTDGQRFAWRPGEPGRWALVRDLHRRAAGPAADLGARLRRRHAARRAQRLGRPARRSSRALVTPGLPVAVTTTLANAGPGPPDPHGRAARRRPRRAGLGAGGRAGPGRGPGVRCRSARRSRPRRAPADRPARRRRRRPARRRRGRRPRSW